MRDLSFILFGLVLILNIDLLNVGKLGLDPFVDILRGWDKNTLGIPIILTNNLDIFGVLRFASDHSVRDDEHDKHHTEEHPNSTAENECNRPTLPRSKRHQGGVNTNPEWSVVMLSMVGGMMGVAVRRGMVRRVVHRDTSAGTAHIVTDIGHGHERPQNLHKLTVSASTNVVILFSDG